MGSDNYLSIGSWKQSEKIINENKIYVYPRKGFDIINKQKNKDVVYLDLDEIDISSTVIRNQIKEGIENVDKYLNEIVFKYIEQNKLY